MIDKKELLKKLKETNLLSLAFIGDSVHTLFVREYVLKTSQGKMQNYHTLSAKYCKAETQAKTLEKIKSILTEEEHEIIRRARNAKPKHQAKNASAACYSEATSFEALIGFLYLSEDEKRLNDILKLSVEN